MPISLNTKVSHFWRHSKFIAIYLALLIPDVADFWRGDVHPGGFFVSGVWCLLGGRQAESFNFYLLPSLKGEFKTLNEKAVFSPQFHHCRVNVWYKTKDLMITRGVLPRVCIQYLLVVCVL